MTLQELFNQYLINQNTTSTANTKAFTEVVLKCPYNKAPETKPVPIPGAIGLMGTTLITLAFVARRRK